MRNYTPALLVALTLAFTGCNSIEHHSEGAYTAAVETSGNYDSLSGTITSATSRIQYLRKNPGTPEAFVKSFEEIQSQIANAGDALKDSRESLIGHGMDHAKLLNEESAKFSDPDLASKVSSDSSDLRERYTQYEKDSADVSASVDKAVKLGEDVLRMMDLNRSAKGVENCRDTLSKIESALTEAKGRIPAAKASLDTLRRHMPRPTSL